MPAHPKRLSNPKNRSSQQPDLESLESRRGMAKLITRLFELWELDTATQLNLLGLSQTSRTLLSKYRKGEPLSVNRDTLDRVGWLLAIHKALRLLYPYNQALRSQWVNHRNRAFNHHTPLEEMTEQGLIGIARVARYLDYQRGR